MSLEKNSLIENKTDKKNTNLKRAVLALALGVNAGVVGILSQGCSGGGGDKVLDEIVETPEQPSSQILEALSNISEKNPLKEGIKEDLINPFFRKNYQNIKNFPIPLLSSPSLNYDYYLSREGDFFVREKGGFIYLDLKDLDNIFYLSGEFLKKEKTFSVSESKKIFSIDDILLYSLDHLPGEDSNNRTSQSLQLTGGEKEESSFLEVLNSSNKILNNLKNFLSFNLGLDETNFIITNDKLEVSKNNKTLVFKIVKNVINPKLPQRMSNNYKIVSEDKDFALDLEGILSFVEKNL